MSESGPAVVLERVAQYPTVRMPRSRTSGQSQNFATLQSVCGAYPARIDLQVSSLPLGQTCTAVGKDTFRHDEKLIGRWTSIGEGWQRVLEWPLCWGDRWQDVEQANHASFVRHELGSFQRPQADRMASDERPEKTPRSSVAPDGWSGATHISPESQEDPAPFPSRSPPRSHTPHRHAASRPWPGRSTARARCVWPPLRCHRRR